jgi:hypothetical protein
MKNFIPLILGFLFSLPIPAQNSGLSGRVTVEGKPAARVLVILLPGQRAGGLPGQPLAQTSTDAEGKYRFTNLRAGSYDVTPRAPAYVFLNAKPRQYFVDPLGLAITVQDNEEIKDVDFALARGGVIAGRVSYPSGRPVIGEQIWLVRLENGKRQTFPNPNRLNSTDDRGNFRLYGLPAGRYLVRLGVETKNGGYAGGASRSSFLAATYAPGTDNADEARVFELAAGQEITDANVKVGARQNSYEAHGRVVTEDGDQQAPPNTYVEAAAIAPDGKENFFFGGVPVSEKGRFVLPGIMPGRYRATAQIYFEGGEYAPQSVVFEVKDEDVNDLKIVLPRGLSIEGVVVVENTSRRPAPPPTEIRVLVRIGAPGKPDSVRKTGTPAPDGSFRLSGLIPGPAEIYAQGKNSLGLHLLRVERDGLAQTNNRLELAAGQSVTGVRIVCAYGTGVIVGRATIENGPLPPGVESDISIRRADANARQPSEIVEIDDSLRFRAEGLLPGEYEITVTMTLRDDKKPRSWKATKTVHVNNDAATDATLTIDAGQEEKKP